MKRFLFWALTMALFCTLLPTAANAQTNELIFDWPVGQTNGNDVVPGYGFEVLQSYGNHYDCIDYDNGEWVIIREVNQFCSNPPCYYCGRFHGDKGTPEVTGYGYRVHAGLDLVAEDGGSVGESVYAAADGVVDCVETPPNLDYPAGVVVVKHTLPDASNLYTMYGHIDNIAVSETDDVDRGDLIGTIADQSLPHLHYEIRTFDENGIDLCAGDGYSQPGEDNPNTEGYRDPAATYFDEDHRPELPITVTINTDTANLRAEPKIAGDLLTTASEDMRLPALELAADADGVSGRYWYKVRVDQANEGYVAAYDVPGWSGDILAVERTRPDTIDPDNCTCSWGVDSNSSPIPDANTFCHFEVCGNDDQFYRCNSWGWSALGKVDNTDCEMPEPLDMNCTCYNGVRYDGSPIDPGSTYCGMQVCGADDQYYTCETGGWAYQGGGPCAP
ncbi:MAG: M23 family metallopeptidase [Acidobacteriota bacterium]|nr:M23 family metallopeptidase [Acidobacteriota bacterium]